MSAPIEVFSAALRGELCSVSGLGAEGGVATVPMARWSGPADTSDTTVLDRCVGVTLDIGCGPGRMTQALAARGVCSLGIDVVPEAVAQTRARGASAMLRDVFGRVPGEGRWDCALLADGNIGIGGDPLALLRRVRTLLRAHGRVIVDLSRPGFGMATRTLRLHVGEQRSDPFAWSVVSPEALPELARAAGLAVSSMHEHGSRWFAVLERGGGHVLAS